jgi:hypothetical protein
VIRCSDILTALFIEFVAVLNSVLFVLCHLLQVSSSTAPRLPGAVEPGSFRVTPGTDCSPRVSLRDRYFLESKIGGTSTEAAEIVSGG